MGVFPVDPADVPPAAVRAVRRTLLRNPRDGGEDELARYIVAVVIAALAEPDGGAEQSLRLCAHKKDLAAYRDRRVNLSRSERGPMPEDTTGERVRRVRKLRGFTQRELAARSGLALRTVKTVEQGTGHPRVQTLRAIAKALQVTTTRLMTSGQDGPDPVAADVWDDVRDALYRPAAGDGDEPATEAGVLAALAAVIPDLAANRYGRVRAVLPALIRDSAALGGDGRCVRSAVLNATAWLLTQTRQWEDASTAAHLARGAARGRLDAAAAVSTECWCLLRQGRLDEAATLAGAWADQVEPRFSRATTGELAAWGKLLLCVNNAAVRDNRPDDAADALSLAKAAADRIGREVRLDRSTARTFGPVSVAMIAAENAAITGKPDRVLRIAGKLPRSGLLYGESAARRRHGLDVACAHVMLRDYGEAVAVMDGLRVQAPEWLAQQRYARDILEDVVSRRRTLTGQMRELAAAVRLPL